MGGALGGCVDMYKRVVEISLAKTYLSVRNGQLVVRQGVLDQGVRVLGVRGRMERAEGSGVEHLIPCEDIGLLLVDHRGVTYTHSVLTELVEAGAAVVFCGADHHPVGVILPVAGHSIQTARRRDQVAVKEPLKQQGVQHCVTGKVRH